MNGLSRDDIIRMAREAGIERCNCEPNCHLHTGGMGSLATFAALVAAAERERIIAANAPEIEKVNVYIKALEDAVAAEREACAVIAFNAKTYLEAAAAIRARGAP